MYNVQIILSSDELSWPTVSNITLSHLKVLCVRLGACVVTQYVNFRFLEFNVCGFTGKYKLLLDHLMDNQGYE